MDILEQIVLVWRIILILQRSNREFLMIFLCFLFNDIHVNIFFQWIFLHHDRLRGRKERLDEGVIE